MPYEIVKKDKLVCVVKTGGETVFCYEGNGATAKAKRLIAALNANVEDAEGKSASLGQQENRIREAWYARFEPRNDQSVGGDSSWVKEVYADRVIVEKRGQLFAYSYMEIDNTVTFGEPVEVQIEYLPVVPMKSCAVKALTEDDAGCTVGGYLLLWGDSARKDVHGDYFTPETNLWLDYYKSVPLLFHHGLDKDIGVSTIGKRVDVKADAVGVFVKSWIDKHSKYWNLVKPLLDAEALHYSPGSAIHMIKRATDGKLTSFPIIEDTMTALPAQHRLMLRPIEEIKAAYKAAGIDMPQTESETAGAGALDVERLRAALQIEQQLLSIVEV